MKKQVEEDIGWAILAAKGRGEIAPAAGPLVISFEWHESDKRRDLDNIFSAKKFILDALQRTGIIANDNRKNVVGLNDTIIDDTEDMVIVTIQEAEWRK